VGSVGVVSFKSNILQLLVTSIAVYYITVTHYSFSKVHVTSNIYYFFQPVRVVTFKVIYIAILLVTSIIM